MLFSHDELSGILAESLRESPVLKPICAEDISTVNRAGHYVASSGYQVKHERCIFDLGDKATDAHYNQALRLP